jgi:linoleoyl-CoA desaturase
MFMSKRVGFGEPIAGFSLTLKRKIDEYFAAEGKRSSGTFNLYLKTVTLFAIGGLSYYLLVFCTIPVWASVLLCVVFGLDLAAIGFNVMHDGAHGSYSKKTWVNEMMAYTLNLMGGSSFMWKQKHNVNHHSYTNVDGLDDDIDIKPWIRTNENQRRYWFHRYQYIYWAFLYGFTYLLWVYSNDFRKYFSGKVANLPLKKMSFKEHVIFWFSKLLYLFVFVTVPILKVGFIKTLVGYIIISFVCGWVLSVVFQLAHVVTEVSFPVADKESNTLEHEWTVHQITTTANFGTRSKLLSWFVGGLNFQIEHHLFPKVSHVHYTGISKIVKDLCKEHNIPYIEYPTLFKALRAHVSYLKMMGTA